MIILKNLKTNRPKKIWDDKWESPYKALKVYDRAVIVEIPDNIHVNNSFHSSLVRPWVDPTIPEQSNINDQEHRCVAGRVPERDDHGKIADKWVIEKILDVHDEEREKKGLIHLIKRLYNDVPSWRPESDLKGCENDLRLFIEKTLISPGPLA